MSGCSSRSHFCSGVDFLRAPAPFEPENSALAAVGINEEAIGVIEPMVEMVACLVGQPEAKLETAVGERQPVDVEAQRPLARRLVPAELAGVLHARREQQAGVGSQLVRQARWGEPAVCFDANAQGQRLPGEELPALGAVRREQLDLGDARLAAPPLAQTGL